MIVVYCSSHGWGHNVRMIPILNELFNYKIEVVTTAPEWLIESSMTNKRWHKITYRNLRTDPGCVQSDPFTIDIDATIEAWKESMAISDEMIKREVEIMKQRGNVRLIISDISYVGQVVAEQIGVPSVCVATFDWAFIHYEQRGKSPEFDKIMDQVAEVSAKFDYCLMPGAVCLPLGIGKQQIQFNWVSRKPRYERSDIRAKLGLGLYDDSVLLSFGGHTVNSIPAQVWSRFRQYHFFVLVSDPSKEEPPASNVHLLSSEEWSGLHVDLVNTVDVVMGKLGYGLLSEVLTTKSKFLVVDRPGNPECDVLKKVAPPVVPYRQITREQFLRGDWYKLNELIEVERNDLDYSECPTNGEVEIAAWIRKLLGDSAPICKNPKNLVIPIIVLIIAIIMYFFLK